MLKLTICYLIPAVFCYKTANLGPAADQLVTYNKTHKERLVIRMAYGAPVESIETSLTAGPHGPLLVQDFTFFERLAHFARERIPERTVHAKGAGAFGYFEVTNDITKYTKACLFSEVGKKTPLAVRFSTSAGERGTPDTVRDLRGFALKFYTEEGIYDLMTLGTPTFFIRDPMLFPQLIHSQKKNPATNLKDPNMFWDFVSLRPQAILQTMYIYGDMGIPDGFRYMDGFGGNTFTFVNKDNDIFYVKFHLKSDLGTRYLTSEVANNLTAVDPDYSVRDLYDAIGRKQYPSWTFSVQVMTVEQAINYRWNAFDITKLWSEEEYPLQPIGKIYVNRNPINYFNEVEQIAFNPGHLVPGIEPSNDKVLQGRMFIYGDTQRYRVGPNFEEIPVNTPKRVRVVNYQRDSPQNYMNQGGAPNYYPNSFGGPHEAHEFTASTYNVSGTVARYNTNDDDNFSQPAMLWLKMPTDERERMVENIVSEVRKTIPLIQERTVKVFKKVNATLGQKIQKGLLH